MLDSLIHTSVRERRTVIVITILLVGVGLFLSRNMTIDVLPNVSAPVVTILTEAPGMPPEEVEMMISYVLETSLVGAEGVRRVTSTSMQGFSVIKVEFEWDVELQDARQIAGERLQGMGDRLPEQSGAPFLAPVTSIMGEIMLVGITSKDSSLMALRAQADFVLRRELLAMPGVAAVSVYGGDRKQFVVEPDPIKIGQMAISLDDLIDAAENASSSISGGFLNHSGREYSVGGYGRASTIDDLNQAVVTGGEGVVPVLLQDVATVSVRPAPKIGEASINAQDGIILVINKEPLANTLELTRQIEEKMEDLAVTLPEGVAIHTELFQQARFIDIAIQNIFRALLISGILVVIVLFVFLNNWRATLISLVAIPVSVILSVLVLWMAGLNFNTMTLGGIAIAIGVLVDDAIVFVENIYRRLRQNSNLPEESRSTFLHIIGRASCEIKTPIVLANFSIVIVFLPLFFLTGLEGRLLIPLGVAYVTTIGASLLVALILTPAMSAWLLSDSQKQLGKKSWVSEKLERGYRPVLTFCFRYRGLVLAGVVLLLVGTIALIPGIGRSFLPEFNEGTLNVGLTTLPGTSLQESHELGREVEKVLLEHPAVISTARRTGRAEMDEHTMRSHVHEMEVLLDEGRNEMDELIEELRGELSAIPGLNISIDQPITHRIDHMLTGVRTNLGVKIYGPERARLQQISREIEQVLGVHENIRDIQTEEQVDVPQVQILPDREALAMHGFSIGRLSKLIRTAFGGVVVDQIYDDPAVFDLVVRFSEEHRLHPEAVSNTPVEVPAGGHVRLGDLAEVRVGYAPGSINRENASRMVVTQANIVGGDLRGTVQDLRNQVAEEVDLGEGYVVSFEGQFQQEEEATHTILWVSLISLVLIYLALHLAFRSSRQSVLVLLNLPLALIGGILVVRFGLGVLSIAGLIGFITLFGIAVRNGMILISQYNQLIKEEGKEIREAVMTGSVNRLQPIMMTIITTTLALVPLVMTSGQPGNEIQGPMAAVILGGLVSATLLNMIVVPLLFDWIFRKEAG